MKVTAEGVETAEQHLFLRAAGVHYMQGLRFGRPAEPAEIAASKATPGPRWRADASAHTQSILTPIAVTIGRQRSISPST